MDYWVARELAKEVETCLTGYVEISNTIFKPSLLKLFRPVPIDKLKIQLSSMIHCLESAHTTLTNGKEENEHEAVPFLRRYVIERLHACSYLNLILDDLAAKAMGSPLYNSQGYQRDVDTYHVSVTAFTITQGLMNDAFQRVPPA